MHFKFYFFFERKAYYSKCTEKCWKMRAVFNGNKKSKWILSINFQNCFT